jgi:CheY-like chemotaxis protein
MKKPPPTSDAGDADLIRRLERLAHGIRTPLHAILGTAELLRDDLVEDAHRAQMATILQAADTALTCLDRILTDCRIDQVQGVVAPAKGSRGQIDRSASVRPHPALPRDSAPHILVVDDNRVSCILTKEMLERAGYRVKTAADGKEAVDIFRGRDFDLVLLDLEMPIMDGFMAHEKMRDEDALHRRTTPIVALTADSAASSAERALRCGFDAYLVKPLARTELLAAVQKYLAINE